MVFSSCPFAAKTSRGVPETQCFNCLQVRQVLRVWGWRGKNADYADETCSINLRHEAEGEEPGRVRMLLQRGVAQADGAGGDGCSSPPEISMHVPVLLLRRVQLVQPSLKMCLFLNWGLRMNPGSRNKLVCVCKRENSFDQSVCFGESACLEHPPLG